MQLSPIADYQIMHCHLYLHISVIPFIAMIHFLVFLVFCTQEPYTYQVSFVCKVPLQPSKSLFIIIFFVEMLKFNVRWKRPSHEKAVIPETNTFRVENINKQMLRGNKATLNVFDRCPSSIWLSRTYETKIQ